MFVKLRLHTVIVLFAAISMIACGDPSPGNGNAVPDSGSLGDGGLFDGQIGDDDVTASDDAKGGDDAASSDDTTAATDVTGGDDTAVATDAGGDDDASSGDDAGTAGDGGGTADGSATDGSTTDGAGTCPGGTGCACEKADDCDSKDCRPPAGGGAKVCQPPCKPTTPPDEVCDGIDNDCNDKIDDTTCDDGNLCTENSCDKGTDDKYACTASPTKDGESCDDGSKCTENDACSQGKCAGSAVDCNDSNPCTDDSCDPKTGCTNANNTGVCDDGSVCTEGEACADGKCAGGKTKVCDDGNSCTKDACDIAVGCTTTNDDGAACDDTDPCTDKDACKDGACAAGVAKSCDDSDPCTIDLCDSKTGKCSNEKAKDGGSCNDGNPCTDTDVCTGGKCAGQKSTCDDSDPCTADSCDPKKGCINTASTGGDCDDSNPCTEADKCGKDGCTGQLKDCDDKNTCTSDSCDPKTGCTNTAVDGNCDDGDKCTSTDACKDGACSGTGGKDCDDGNPCTADGCDATTGECTHKAQAGKCDDGSKCTSDDKCDGGKCTGKSADCDDSKPCTTDTCDKDTGCKHDNNTDSCDDGNACTSKDVCEDGKCVGAPLPKSTCDDKNLCTKDSCNPKTGCVNTNADGVTCDDGNACTGKDTCKAGQCTPGANTCQCKSNEDCKDDGNLCNGTPMCQNNKCVTNPKTVVTCDASKDTSCKVNTCNKGNGQCALQVTNEGKVCKEGSKCTVNNLCTKGVCVNSTKPKCVDGNACTTDLCDAKTGDCAFKAIAGCTACKDASVCDDKNPCTKDACAGGKCSNTPISGCSLAPDLKPGTPSLNKTLYLAGSSLTAKYVVSNVGFSSAGSRFDRLYLSKDTKLGAGDMLIGTKTVASLGSKKLQLVTFTAKVPEATKTGGWYVIVVVDATNKVKEANEGNNRSVRLTKVQGLSDLRINTYKPSTTATFQGGKVSFSLVVSNGGSIKAPITKAQFYISKDAKIDSKDLKAYSWNVSALDPGKSWSGTRYALIPKTLPNGTYYIGLQVDDAKAVLEANENNNIRWVKVAVGPAPDIQALAFSGSTTMYAASKYTMSMTEKNIGDKSAGAYVNSIFLSTNTTWDKSDIKLLDIKRGGLLKGAQVSVKALATIPAATKTGTYYLIFRADSTNAIAEKSEFNNQRWLKVNILGRSDLVPYTTLPNAKGWAPGATGTVSYRERNIGTGKSSTYYSRFYLSANGVLGSGDIALTTNLLRGALSPTQVSGYGKATFKIPTTVKPGKYYLLHRVDSTSKNIEVSESNNIKAIAVTILAKPDLAPTAVKLSKTSANAGTSVGVSYTITNKGGSATGTSYTGFYLSTSATSVAGPLVGVSTLTSLAGGKSAQLSRSFTIPATLKAGTYYVLVRADYNSKIAESSESNNIIAAKIVVYAAKLADLQVISAKLSSTKTAFRPGQTVGVTVTVKNTGVLSTGTWTIGRYISANTTISTADPYLGFNTRSSLAPGATSTFTVYSSIPKNQKAGTWYVGAYLDHKYAIKEILESNNKTAGLKISVIATADLLSKTLTTNKPYYKPGETVSFATTYQNIGTASTGTFYAGLRLSTNSFISSSDPLMKTVARASLTPGASGSLSSSFKLPTTTKPGIYYIGVRLDDQLKIAEISESNNVKWVKVTVQDPLTKKADLIPYLTKPSKTAYIAGQTMYVSGYERNIGNVTATSHSFRVYLSRYTTSISGAKYLKNVTVSSLAANGLKSIAGNISIPANTASGTWYVQFRADHAGQVSELQEGNNIASVKVAITALADLRSLSMSTDKAFYTPGSTAKVTWSEYNLGGANAGAYTTGLYLSTNTAISGADKLMKTLSRSGLAASKSLSTSTSIVIPKATAAGTYYLGVWLDNGNKVTESSNTNNFRVVKITVTSTALKPDLYISSFTSTTTSYKAGQTFSVSGVGRNIGKASAGTFRIGYYLSSNSLISTGDIFLGYKTVSSLGVGGSVSLFKYVKLPVGTKSGTWYIGALMDYQAKVSEGVETNNYRAKPIKVTAVPDLSALKISTSVAYYKPGAKMLVTISERNLGGLTAGTHTVGVYLSTNTFISTSKKLLYNFTVSSLGAGATFTKSAYVTLPSNTVPGNYYLGMYSDNGNKIAEASEGNQTRSWKFTVQSTSLKPDLIPYLFKPAKTAYKVGETLSWSGYERNVGGSTAGSHYFRVYLCKTSYYTTAKGYCFLAKNLLKSSLAKNGLTSVASSWKIPTSVGHGTWYVIGSADHLKQVGESIETNNVASIKISVAGLADLTPYSLALNKYSFKPGETITSYLRERNIGGLTTPKYYTRYYLSTDKTITSSDLLLKTVYRASLTPGAISPTYTTGLLIPKGLKAGTYYLGVYSDALNQVAETTNANNTYSRTTTVLALTTKPDLSTTDFKTTTTSYTASSTVYTSGYVKNIGGVNASAFRVSYYLSTDSNITTADTLLRSVNRSGLAAGGQSSLATSFKFPANLKAGTYYVGVYIDDLNQVSELTEANNRRANGVKFVARADLDIDYFRTSKGYYKPGETVTVYLRERNLGGATAGTHTIRVYVSTNSTISTADTYIGATTVTSLGSGATTTRTLNLKMPSKGAGTYYIGAYADIENKVPEITSANNSIYQRVTVPSTSIKPDLLPEYTYISAATMTGGATVYVSGRVRNAGKLSSGLYKVSYYIHSSSYLPSTLKPVAVVNKTSLAAGGISSLSRSLPVPTTAKSGTWYVHIRVDSANQVSESNESNNFWVQAVPVVAKADLAVLSIKTSKTSYKPGEKVSVTYVLRNQGSVDAKAFYTRAYRSTNSTITTSDTYRAQRYDAIVAAGQTITRTISFTMASLPKGAKYYYGVYADYSNKVSEPTTANNRKAAAVITVL